MTNFEFFRDAKQLRYAFDAYQAVTAKSPIIENGQNVTVLNSLEFGYKSADTALQPELKPGTLVQIKTNLHGEGVILHFAVVVEPTAHSTTPGILNQVKLRFAAGEVYSFDVYKRVFAADTDPDTLVRDDIKLVDIPQEILKLVGCVNLDKCPLKKEGACLDGE